MQSSRQQLFLLAVGLAVVVVAVNGTSLNLGRRVAGDGLVCYGDVNLRAQPGQVINTQRVCNVARWNQSITQISAIDLGVRGRGGYAQVIKGGLNQKNVTLYLWSQKSQPLNFTIQVYAKPYY